MKLGIELQVNGQAYRLEVEPRATLLEVLREQLALTGSKEGCDGGECGACTVLLEGEPVLSCLMLAVEAEGKKITTVEGLARDGQLDQLQEAFISEGAIQCGFCTPGMLMSARALLDKNAHPATGEIKEALSGNLCRCTGYGSIVRAVMRAAGAEQKAEAKIEQGGKE